MPPLNIDEFKAVILCYCEAVLNILKMSVMLSLSHVQSAILCSDFTLRVVLFWACLSESYFSFYQPLVFWNSRALDSIAPG